MLWQKLICSIKRFVELIEVDGKSIINNKIARYENNFDNKKLWILTVNPIEVLMVSLPVRNSMYSADLSKLASGELV